MLCGLVVHVQSPAASDRETRTTNLTAYAELLRSDVRAEKVAILTEVMGFTDAEDKAFWPIYREYDAEMSKLGDERVALIDDFASHYSQLTDAMADEIGTKRDRPRVASPGRQGQLLIASRRHCHLERRCATCRSSISCS
jgi:hypothetical protein